MNHSKRYLLLLTLLISSVCLKSQNETAKWFFGNHAGLDFMSSPPTPINSGTMTAFRGSASVADASGNLLFYTNGDTVWNSSHNIMANGSGLFGFNADQVALILKQPGGNNYYIFTNKYGNGFYYSIVDMSLAAGSGSVIIKNAPIFSGLSCGYLNAAKHCNGIDYWILTADYNNSSSMANFYAYALTASGVNTVAVTSTVTNTQGQGYIKLSPNGKKLSATRFATGSVLSATSSVLTLYDFDNNLGTLSNPIVLATQSSLSSAGFSPYGSLYGTEFSPDGTKLYASNPQGAFYGNCSICSTCTCNTTGILQWDLCAGSATAIASSQYLVSRHQMTILPNGQAYTSYFGMQLAPDSKIYISTSNTQSLSVINNPNAAGAACNFSYCSQSIGTGTCSLGLPNFANSFFLQAPNVGPFTYTVNAGTCQTTSFTAPPAVQNFSTMGCSSSGNSLSHIAWNFGDPSSGTANTSTLTNPSHYYSALGMYTVQLILYYDCNGLTDTLTQTVNAAQLCISVGSASITCASLGSATATVQNGVGPFTYTWFPGGQTTSTVSGLSPGAYTLTVYDTNLNITTTKTLVFNSVIPLSGNLNYAPSSCFGASTASANFSNLAGGSGSEYYNWSNSSGTTYTVPVPLLGSGIWSVTVTDVLTSCQIIQAFYIAPQPAMILNLSGTSSSVCVNGNAILSGTNTGGTPFVSSPFYTYTWTAGTIAILPPSDTRTVTEVTSGIHVYTLTSSDANSCMTSNTIAVNFIPLPVLSISNISICPLSVGIITVSGATSYSWSDNSVGNSLSDNPPVNTQYTVTGSALGCSSSTVASIILKPVPNAFISSNSPRCNGDNLSLTGVGANNFLWSGPNNFTSSVQIPTLTNVSLNNAGVYAVTVTAANSCTNSATHTVIVHPSPTLSVLGTTVCTSQTLNLSSNSNATVFLWTGPQSFSSSLQNPFISSPTIAHGGTYTLKVTSAQGCTSSAQAIASVISPPSLTGTLSSNGTLCAQALNGSPNTITLTSGGATTYTLFTPNHISNQNAAGPSYSMSSLPPFNSGPATATLMGSNGVCSVSLAINFSVIPNPTLSPLSPTPVICAGETFTYTSSGATSYSWGPGSPNLTTYTGPATVASPTQTSVYSVVGGNLGCNSGTQTSTITVRPLPQFSINPVKPNICLNEKITLTALGNAESYTWSPYTGLNSMNGFSVSAGPLSQQNYSVLGVLNTCTSTAVITVSVLPLPTVLASVINDKLCVNGLVSLHGSGGISYTWEGPLDLKLAGETATFVANSVNYSGNYILTATDTNGCKNKSNVDLIVYNLPGGNLFASKQEGCVPFSSEFKSSVTSTNVIGNWSLENKTYNTKNFSHTFSNPGTYTMNGNFKDSVTSCASTSSFVVKANPNPIAGFSFFPEKPIENLDEVIFTNTSEGEQQTKWNWYFTSNQGYQSQNKNTSYQFTDAGTYPVAMVVSNVWGCSDTLLKHIVIESDLVIYVPNVFTPNGDDLNETFLPVSRGLKEYELSVFDRWGAKVFSTSDAQAGWDGTFRGEVCKTDVYVWKIVLSSVNGEMKTLTGHLTLSR